MNAATPPPLVDALVATVQTDAVRRTRAFEDGGICRVRAEIGAHCELATYDLSGFGWLDDKRGALSVYAPVDGDPPEVSGKIAGFE